MHSESEEGFVVEKGRESREDIRFDGLIWPNTGRRRGVIRAGGLNGWKNWGVFIR